MLDPGADEPTDGATALGEIELLGETVEVVLPIELPVVPAVVALTGAGVPKPIPGGERLLLGAAIPEAELLPKPMELPGNGLAAALPVIPPLAPGVAPLPRFL